jgi:hypothetical protein
MKKFLFVLLAFVAGTLAVKSYADTAKPVATAAVSATDSGLLEDTSGVPNDQDLSWKTSVEDQGLKQGDEGYEDARQLCIKFGKDFEAAHALKNDGKWLEAAKVAPYSWVKACYLYNYAASLVADKNDDNEWQYDPTKIATDGDQAIKYFNMAKAYSDKAVQAGITGTGANSTENLNARIAGGLKAINDVQHPAPVKHKHKKKAPVEDDSSDDK